MALKVINGRPALVVIPRDDLPVSWKLRMIDGRPMAVRFLPEPKPPRPWEPPPDAVLVEPGVYRTPDGRYHFEKSPRHHWSEFAPWSMHQTRGGGPPRHGHHGGRPEVDDLEEAKLRSYVRGKADVWALFGGRDNLVTLVAYAMHRRSRLARMLAGLGVVEVETSEPEYEPTGTMRQSWTSSWSNRSWRLRLRLRPCGCWRPLPDRRESPAVTPTQSKDQLRSEFLVEAV